MMRNSIVLAALLAGAFASAASADVMISGSKTKNMTCSNGVCAPTAAKATLNIGDLENLLATEPVKVVTTNGSTQAKNIVVLMNLSWSSAFGLTLNAYRSILFSAPVTAQGTVAFTLVTNDGGSGGTLTFLGTGKLNFGSPSSTLKINGQRYLLEPSLPQLTAGIAAKPRGHFALALDYDADADGTYYTSPVPVPFGGTFNGLGHTISNLTILDGSDVNAGLFSFITSQGSLGSVILRTVAIDATNAAGALAGENDGTISNCSAMGRVRANVAGGLVASNDNRGKITTSKFWRANSFKGAQVYGSTVAGGLAGVNGGTITLSFVSGKVIGGEAGGLAGVNGTGGIIENSYASGSVEGTKKASYVGGFVGLNYNGAISDSYAKATIRARGSAEAGGFSGADQGTINDGYWDTDKGGDQGSGDGNDSGLTGLTYQQFRAGLPDGFDPKIWVEEHLFNNGFPYLIANPPE